MDTISRATLYHVSTSHGLIGGQRISMKIDATPKRIVLCNGNANKVTVVARLLVLTPV